MSAFDPATHRMIPEQRWFDDFRLGERLVLPSRTMTEALFLAFQAASGDNHPVHMHRHTFELTKVSDKTTAGLMKDTINMTRFSTVEIDFVADDPGPTLLHCHHQDHQDEGFMGLMTYL